LACPGPVPFVMLRVVRCSVPADCEAALSELDSDHDSRVVPAAVRLFGIGGLSCVYWRPWRRAAYRNNLHGSGRRLTCDDWRSGQRLYSDWLIRNVGLGLAHQLIIPDW
jgi:hypothetical protein